MRGDRDSALRTFHAWSAFVKALQYLNCRLQRLEREPQKPRIFAEIPCCAVELIWVFMPLSRLARPVGAGHGRCQPLAAKVYLA